MSTDDGLTLSLLPDGVIAHICAFLMTLDPLTLIVTAPNFCHSWRAVCRDQVSLILNANWNIGACNRRFPKTQEAYTPTIIKRFGWVKKLALDRPISWEHLAHVEHLTALALAFRENADIAVASLAAVCHGLECVNLDGCCKHTYLAVEALVAGCPRLVCVNFGDSCNGPTHLAVEALAACPGLKYANLTFTLNVTNSTIATLATGCKFLEHLNLTFCCRITDAAIGSLAAGCKGLKCLVLDECYNITDAALVLLAAGCKGLVQLDLSHCSKITDAAFGPLAAGGIGLEHLGLAHCPKITDATCVSLAAGFPGLRSLNLSYCPVTGAAIEALTGCRSLESLDFSGCSKITDSALAQLVALFAPGAPGLRALNLYRSNISYQAYCELDAVCDFGYYDRDTKTYARWNGYHPAMCRQCVAAVSSA
jgi:hypothetical protein